MKYQDSTIRAMLLGTPSPALLRALLATALVSTMLFSSLAAAPSQTTGAAVWAESADMSAMQLAPMPEHNVTTRNIVDALAGRHYVHTRLNDDLSSRVFDAYLDDLDPSRSYLLQSDVNEFSIYRFSLDNALRFGDLKPAFVIFNRYQQRVLSRFQKVLRTLEDGLEQFDFTRTEELNLDRDEAVWATTPATLDDLWRRRLKDSILNLKMTDKEPDKILELLTKRYTNRLARSRQTNSEDVYQLYMNSFTKTYDPHTQYFSPRTSENFNINMSLSLEGIGAVLRLEDEFTRVERLVTAGPAEKAGQLKPNDKIIGVGQGEMGEIVDVIGWRLDEVVDLIRGKKGTTVRLNIIPAVSDTNESRVIQIVRNKVELEEQSASAEVMEIEQPDQTYKIGVIQIPAFYVDFQAMQNRDPNFRSTTRDVAKLIVDLKKQQVSALVIDLRNNGGGALQEARSLTGLFIDRGPTVQVRKKSNRVDILDDRSPGVLYDGPMAVLVNRLSASASEIFAGAIQDYERGLVIGTQTFGKGTVQSLLPLTRGQLKLTQAKFYRISGESTQHRGIIPDITYPPRFDPETIGESTLEHPIAWDQIQATKYNISHELRHLLPELQARHAHRVADNPEFNYLKEAFAYRKTHSNDKTVTLNEEERIAEKDEREAFWVALENRKRTALGQEPITSLDDLNDDKTVAQATSGGAAIVPLRDEAKGSEGADGVGVGAGVKGAGADGTQSNDAASAPSAYPVAGSEMAVASPSSSPGSSPSSSPSLSPNSADASIQNPAAPDAASSKPEKEIEPPDPWLVESGHVLIDLLSLENRTASSVGPSQGEKG